MFPRLDQRTLVAGDGAGLVKLRNCRAWRLLLEGKLEQLGNWPSTDFKPCRRNSTLGASASIYKAHATKGEPRKWGGDFRAIRPDRFALRPDLALAFSVEAKRTLPSADC